MELPQGQWTDLVTVLVNNVIGPSSTEIIKEASLEAIGYICQVGGGGYVRLVGMVWLWKGSFGAC